jgi:hypothetical protein
LESGAEVKNLGIVDVNVSGVGSNVAGLVGRNDGGIVTICYSTGAVTGQSSVGGLVGDNWGAVTRCYSTGAIGGTISVGGLIGSNDGTVTDCYSTAAVMGSGFVGGLVGYLSYGGVSQCYSAGLVSGSDHVGGLVGGCDGTEESVWACFWDTTTSGQTTSEGGLGLATAGMQDRQTYQQAGWDFLGKREDGLHETWQMPAEGGYPVLAILSGYAPPPLQGSGTQDDPYLITNALELGAMTYYRADAHYRLNASIDLSGICWATAVIPSFGGNFDGNNQTVRGLTIRGRDLLGLFGELTSGAEVKDLGVVDVNISGSVGGGDGALAGNNWGTLSHCYSTGSVRGAASVGGLAGKNYGTVSLCHSTAEARGDADVGGLVGANDYNGTVTQCYSTGAVSGTDNVGGLEGENGGALSDCHSTGAVRCSHWDVGGLVGWNYGRVTNCYSVGAVSGSSAVGGLVGYGLAKNVTACFWDTRTSGQPTSATGTGRTTAEMQTAGTFLRAGWNLGGEMAMGEQNIWWILEGKDYPRLWWELTEKKSAGTAGE